FWRPSEAWQQRIRTAKYVPVAETVALPPLFSQDLLNVLSLLVRTRLLRLEQAQVGEYPLNELRQRIEEAQRLVDNPRELWNSDDLQQMRSALAEALDVYAERTGDEDYLRRDIELRRLLLAETPRKSNPNSWASAQNNLGNALSSLGERDSDKQ